MEQPVILHAALPIIPWMDARLDRLPGIMPLEAGDWLRVDEVFAAQMALRQDLINDRPQAVHQTLPEAMDAAHELLDMTLVRLSQMPAYQMTSQSVTRPDGVVVPIDRNQPMLTLGRVVQEDLCILQPLGDEYNLTAAILCFPASWTLAQKIGRPMMSIHSPVASYTPDIGARVHRLFAAIRPEQGLWRMNYLTYASADLHHPRLENDPRPRPPSDQRHYLRAERQCLIRLPRTRAVVFSIHTYMMRVKDLSPEARASLPD